MNHLAPQLQAMSKMYKDTGDEFTMDIPSRSRDSKADEVEGTTRVQRRVKAGDHDHNNLFTSEDQLIKTLRDQNAMSWADIAYFINNQRERRNQPAILDVAAVYSRYVLATASTAHPVKEIGFHAKDFNKLRQPAQGKRVKNLDHAKEVTTNLRKALEDSDQELRSEQRTEQLLEAVGRVERGFWDFVADEMERITGGYWKAEELERRYREVKDGATDVQPL
jgi:hypothetical protein